MTRLGQSPPPMCLCGHDFHTGPCEWACDCGTCSAFVAETGIHPAACYCPDGDLDGDR